MGASAEQIVQLNEELHAARTEFNDRFRHITSLDILPIATRAGRRIVLHANVIRLSWMLNLLNLACFVTGIVFAFLGGLISTVGVALVVGALFSEGAFVGQLWTVAAQNSYMAYLRLWGDDEFTQLDLLKEKIAGLSQRIEELSQAERSPEASEQSIKAD